MTPVRSIARVLLGGVFIASGAQAIRRPARYADRAKPLAAKVAPLISKVDERLPTNTEALVRANGVAQLGGGLLLATVDTAGSPSMSWRVRKYRPRGSAGRPRRMSGYRLLGEAEQEGRRDMRGYLDHRHADRRHHAE
jgi:hypothetical protein